MSEVFDEAFEGQVQQGGEAPEFPDEIDPRMVEQIQGLLQLGELHDQFEYLGHEFHIRTMRIGEELSALAQTRAYQDVPLAQGRAYATAIVAGALVSVDGEPVVQELGPGQGSQAALRFAKVSKWYFTVIDYVYKRYLKLEEQQAETLAELQARLEPENDNAAVEELSQNPV